MAPSPLLDPLTSLLPSTTPVHPTLLSAATTLLSLSHQRAANLKPEEEVARSHACAEIACKKLRVHLRLPNVKSGKGAPCRPAVYKRLLAFLEGVLGDVDVLGSPRKGDSTPTRTGGFGAGFGTETGTGTGTGRKRMIGEVDMRGDFDADDDGGLMETPTKKRKVNAVTPSGTTPKATPIQSTVKKTNGFLGRIQASTGKGKGKGIDQNKQDEAPDYALPTVRALCKTFKTPKMVPHVYTGVCVTIAILSSLQSDLEDSNSQTQEIQDQVKRQNLLLILAAFAVTFTRMHKGDLTQDVYDVISERGLAVMGLDASLKEEAEVWIGKVTMWAVDQESAASWLGSVPPNTLPAFKLSKLDVPVSNGETLEKEAITYDPRVVSNESRVVPSRRPRNIQMSRREEIKRELEKEDPDDVLLPGLGTMVHDAVDYFSAERVAEYDRWKAGIMRQIEVIEKGTETGIGIGIGIGTGTVKKGRAAAVAG